MKLQNPLSNLNPERCKHRHTRQEHPNCFPMETKSGERAPKILLFDIETSPMTVFVWGLYKQRINPSNVISDYFVISWSAKWLFSNETLSDVLTSGEAKAGDDARLIKGIWDLLNEADVVIAHNGVQFDIPKLNSRFIINGLTPPLPYKTIDTCTQARKIFGFSSNKLDFIAKKLDLPISKLHTSFELWVDAIHGNSEALETMRVYNLNDVLVLEDLYVTIRPWIKSHPNLALYVESTEEVCPTCLNAKIDIKGEYATPRGLYKAFRCKKCGAVGRCGQNVLSKEKRKSLLSA